jgi:NADH:ubiquinone oxidoreductase subunit 2 (chain N)
MLSSEISEILNLIYYLSPFFTLIFGTIVISFLIIWKKIKIAKVVSYISLLMSLFFTLYFIYNNYTFVISNSTLIIDKFSQLIWLAILAGGIVSLSSMHEELLKREAQPLLLLSVASGLLVISSRDLLILFLSLEATVFPTYALVSQLKRDPISAEATVKYFVFGILSTLLFGYGIALIYGSVGSTLFINIKNFINSQDYASFSNYIMLGLILIILSLAIKATLFPLHVWAIDTYQGSPTSISAYLSSSSKIIGIAAIALLLVGPFYDLYTIFGFELRYIMSILVVATIILPNIAGLVQRNIKRLLAYSSVAHSGYMALVYVYPEGTLQFLAYYLITYSIAKSVSFLITNLISGEGSYSPYDLLRGLFKYRRTSLAAITFAIALLSLAGIPPFAGFMAKFLIFLNTSYMGNLGIALALIALIMSAVSVYYYAYLIRLEVLPTTNGANINFVSRLDSNCVMIISILLLLVLTFYPNLFILPFPLLE